MQHRSSSRLVEVFLPFPPFSNWLTIFSVIYSASSNIWYVYHKLLYPFNLVDWLDCCLFCVHTYWYSIFFPPTSVRLIIGYKYLFYWKWHPVDRNQSAWQAATFWKIDFIFEKSAAKLAEWMEWNLFYRKVHPSFVGWKKCEREGNLLHKIERRVTSPSLLCGYVFFPSMVWSKASPRQRLDCNLIYSTHSHNY